VKVRVWVRKSPIAGLGLFAAQAIKPGTRILPYMGEKISKAESTRRLAQGNAYIFTFNDRYDIDGKILRNTARYSNHSCAPNCAVEQTTRTLWIVALRDITAVDDLLTGHAPGIQDERHMDIGRALPYDTDTLGR
jgi:uncharacterized protein